jgi:hypothetical protein
MLRPGSAFSCQNPPPIWKCDSGREGQLENPHYYTEIWVLRPETWDGDGNGDGDGGLTEDPPSRPSRMPS